MEMGVIIIVAFAAVAFYFIFRPKPKVMQRPPQFPEAWRTYLNNTVRFYRELSNNLQAQFEDDILDFLERHEITGISTEVTDEDRLLVAASAVIPIFGFPEWRYDNLEEVLLYPDSFNHQFETAGDNNDRSILGMVGNGYMNGKMILSIQSLRQGFENESSKTHVGIHEFVHLIDDHDGIIDGLLEVLMEKQYSIPWLQMMKESMQNIHEGDSDINPYGGVSEAEFFPVISEYFFKRPRLLKKKHPRLYEALSRVFRQNPAAKK